PPRVPRAREVQRLAAVELEHRVCHGLEEPAVVRDDHDRRVQCLELALEPFEALDVEVIGRLVEQEEVGIAAEGAREGRARQLAAGERVELPIEVMLREAEAADDRRGVIAPAVPARMLELRLRLGVPSQGCVGVVAGRHRLLESLQLRLDRDEVGRPGEHVLAQRQAALQRWALVMERDARPLLKSQFAALDAGLAGERPEQRRLAGAVRSGQSDAVAPLDLERHAVEERVAGELLPEVRCDQDGHGYSVERTQGSTASPPKTIMVTRSAAGLNARIAVASVLL